MQSQKRVLLDEIIRTACIHDEHLSPIRYREIVPCKNPKRMKLKLRISTRIRARRRTSYRQLGSVLCNKFEYFISTLSNSEPTAVPPWCFGALMIQGDVIAPIQLKGEDWLDSCFLLLPRDPMATDQSDLQEKSKDRDRHGRTALLWALGSCRPWGQAF